MCKALCLGKLSVQTTIGAVVPGKLLHVIDSSSCLKFLVDTGASYSLFPHKSTQLPFGPILKTPNGMSIPSWGESVKTMAFDNRCFTWSFLLADIEFPILGADFLRHFKLVVDLANGQLLDAESLECLKIAAVSESSLPAFDWALDNEEELISAQPGVSAILASVSELPVAYRDIFVRFPEVVNESGKLPVPCKDVVHHIETVGVPCSSRARRLDDAKMEVAKADFLKMESEGICRRSNSPWASPLHMVPKKDGTWRPCGDYRLLNLQTVPDKYPLPLMDDCRAKMAGCKIFSKLDLRKAYWQFAVNHEDIPKTAVITPFGLFEFLRMPFGLMNAGATCQRKVDKTCQDLKTLFGYLDDLLVGSRNEEEHLQLLELLFERLRRAGLVLNMEKCEFGVTSCEFLGHVVSSKGILPMPKHLEAIEDFPAPTCKKTLMSFLGLFNYYRSFVKNAAAFLAPLTNALKGGPKSPFVWTPEMQCAFVKAKMSLKEITYLGFPGRNQELSVAVDASMTHIGGVLQQRTSVENPWEPLGFFSKKLQEAQLKYSAFDRELLAVVQGLRHFRYMLEGRSFHILTDHKPLTFALKRVSEPWSQRQCRSLSAIAELTQDIRHLPGAMNVVADCLSRPAVVQEFSGLTRSREQGAVSTGAASTGAATATSSHSHSMLSHTNQGSNLNIFCSGFDCGSETLAAVVPSVQIFDLQKMADDQSSCPETIALCGNPRMDIRVTVLQNVSILCDWSTGRPRPLVPQGHRNLVFKKFHNLAHCSIRSTRSLISGRYVWYKMNNEIVEFCKSCQTCARSKVQTHARAPVEPIPVPLRRFDHLHVDLVGPLPPSSEGWTHLFTMVDRTTRWCEIVPLSDTSTVNCANALFSGWISRFGVPSSITSDRGSQFSGSIWSSMCQVLGINHSMTTAFHPQANGMVERFHRSLKNALRARCNGSNWSGHLPWVLLGLRTVPKDCGISCAEMVYGTPLVLPGEFVDHLSSETDDKFFVNLSEKMRQMPVMLTRPISQEQRRDRVPDELRAATHVFIRRDGHVPPLAQLYEGPFRVVSKEEKVYHVQRGPRSEVISVDRLKAYVGRDEPEVAVPPARGRPKKPPDD